MSRILGWDRGGWIKSKKFSFLEDFDEIHNVIIFLEETNVYIQGNGGFPENGLSNENAGLSIKS